MAKNVSVGIIWWVALLVGICGILIHENILRVANFSSFWVVTAGFGLMALAGLFRKA